MNRIEDLISVIIPVYNVEEYLPKCISSVIKQTYKQLEIIIVDDGSTDNSGIICDAYAEVDERIKVIHSYNKGVSGALNEGLKVAKGKYITFVDSDDWLELDTYEYALKRMEEDTSIDLVIWNYYTVWTANMYADYLEKPLVLDKIDAIKLLIENSWMKNYRWNKLYKSFVFQDILYPENRIFEDIPVTYQLFEKCNKIYVTNLVKYYYRMRKNSYVHTTTFEDYLDYCIGHQERYNILSYKYPQLKALMLEKYLPVFDEMLHRRKENTINEKYTMILKFFEEHLKCIRELDLLKKNQYQYIESYLKGEKK